ncbi:MAG TPA: competence protein ComA [Candidatus Omnitrophica bacterium]|nr:MAG: hypothetical protein A2Z81_09975 [Omnitrophica WOR_2 bacterium GWA2_45_18]HBR15380.1 competence protein ComA [Candidatus Omnitrophota bacterium]
MRLEQKAAQLLASKKKTVSLAESCTGGLLSHRLTNVPGSSNYLKLAVVAYSNEAKEKTLKISPPLMKKHGAVSGAVATAMAKGVREILKTDFGVSITGIAGPTGGTLQKPTGLTFIAVATELETLCLECRFQGTRAGIKSQAANQALRLLIEFLT